MLSGTVTIQPTDLEEACDSVYLLTDADIDPNGTVTYEATLDGATWTEVPAGQVTPLGHSGTTLQVRATMTLDDALSPEGVSHIYWILAFATVQE